ncbi:hypothetical protein PEBR_16019 [Penicillium brasilianum]|uniref:Uncharacterized protein n=1 Tax=Penicillium brasilianum TaxID=104259 RepID=A0A1S9RQ51_PENBI|nr:hypothetical protein PEBR_16019 [Penicillium brasilianum]
MAPARKMAPAGKMAPARKRPAPKPTLAANMQSAAIGKKPAEAVQSEPELDMEVKQPLSMSSLDLDASYVGVFLSPQGPQNHEGQIERYPKRMGENNVLDHARGSLAGYEKQLAEDRDLKAKYPGLKWQAILRIEDLKQKKAILAERGDPRKMLPNLAAIITAYEGRQIDVYADERLVTYWYKGKQISQPRPFDWEEYYVIAAECETFRSCWVEPIGIPRRTLFSMAD